MRNYNSLVTHLGLKMLVESPLWPRYVERDPRRAVTTYWHYKMRAPLPLDHPQTLNEKIQWLKLYGDQQLWRQWADKQKAKELLTERGLERYLTPTLGIWESADTIDFASLPARFVLKCTHDCGSTVVVDNKEQLDIAKTRRMLSRRLRQPYGYHSTELHYIRIPRRIMAEAIIGGDEATVFTSLTDYKFWCFNGHAELCFICYNRGKGTQQHHVMKDLYRADDFSPLREGLIPSERPHSEELIPRPDNYEEMLHLAEQLSVGHPEVRVDLYNVGGKIYFGEMTFTSFGGIMRYFTPAMQRHLGQLTMLPERSQASL